MTAAGIDNFFDEYRETFARYDADALASRFTFPLHVLSDTGEVTPAPIPDRDAWMPVLERILDAYRTLGVVGGEPLSIEAMELSPRVACARVHWELRREDGSAVYDFTAIYTLALLEGAWRVAAIAHDELPKLQAALDPDQQD